MNRQQAIDEAVRHAYLGAAIKPAVSFGFHWEGYIIEDSFFDVVRREFNRIMQEGA